MPRGNKAKTRVTGHDLGVIKKASTIWSFQPPSHNGVLLEKISSYCLEFDKINKDVKLTLEDLSEFVSRQPSGISLVAGYSPGYGGAGEVKNLGVFGPYWDNHGMNHHPHRRSNLLEPEATKEIAAYLDPIEGGEFAPVLCKTFLVALTLAAGEDKFAKEIMAGGLNNLSVQSEVTTFQHPDGIGRPKSIDILFSWENDQYQKQIIIIEAKKNSQHSTEEALRSYVKYANNQQKIYGASSPYFFYLTPDKRFVKSGRGRKGPQHYWISASWINLLRNWEALLCKEKENLKELDTLFHQFRRSLWNLA